MELVLSLDGGRTFPIRVTRRIDRAATGLRWSVPGLPTEHARLALRVGRDEPPAQERLALVSPEFAIASSTSSPLPEIFWVGGEGRTRDALETAPPPSPPSSTVRAEADAELLSDSFDEPTPETKHGAALLRSRVSTDLPGAAVTATEEEESLRPSRSPLRLPLRL
jgi:hypothetical protein